MCNHAQPDRMDLAEDDEELFDVLRPDNHQPAGYAKPRSAVHRDGAPAAAWRLLRQGECASPGEGAAAQAGCGAQVTGTAQSTSGCSARARGSCCCSSAH